MDNFCRGAALADPWTLNGVTANRSGAPQHAAMLALLLSVCHTRQDVILDYGSRYRSHYILLQHQCPTHPQCSNTSSNLTNSWACRAARRNVVARIVEHLVYLVNGDAWDNLNVLDKLSALLTPNHGWTYSLHYITGLHLPTKNCSIRPVLDQPNSWPSKS
jgi:hypothetical protein